jgi:hypothetical protein
MRLFDPYVTFTASTIHYRTEKAHVLGRTLIRFRHPASNTITPKGAISTALAVEAKLSSVPESGPGGTLVPVPAVLKIEIGMLNAVSAPAQTSAVEFLSVGKWRNCSNGSITHHGALRTIGRLLPGLRLMECCRCA